MGGPHQHHPGVENDWPGEQLLLGEQRGGAVNTDGVPSLKAAAATCYQGGGRTLVRLGGVWREREKKFGLNRKELVDVFFCELTVSQWVGGTSLALHLGGGGGLPSRIRQQQKQQIS